MLLTTTEYTADLATYAGSATLDLDTYITRLNGMDRARVDASIVPGTPAGYSCERCSARTATCTLDAHDGLEDLCLVCTVTRVDEALFADPDVTIGVEVQRTPTRD